MEFANAWFIALRLAAALGCGLIGGVFFAFSAFVMRGLARLAPPQGIAAMQSVNVTAVTPPFMTALFGTALICLVLGVSGLRHVQAPGAAYLLAGSLLYLAGTVVVTIAFNVPLNDALAAAKPDSADGAAVWARYLSSWTAWNNVRTVTSLAAAASFTLALCQRATP